jgi:hypothetical protein
MIALKNNLPLLRKPRGHAVSFRRTWLQNALRRAAAKAGYSEWWIAEDLTKSVVFYLEHHYLEPIIAVPLLENAVRSALREIGYRDVAVHFGSRSELQFVSLLRFFDCSKRPDSTRFFEKLSSWFQDFGKTPVKSVAFQDLMTCSACLANAEELNPTTELQQNIQDLIVNFIHAEISQLHAEDFLREVRCSIQ